MDEFASPFERLGSRAAIARLVERFYQIMDSDPAYAELRAMHGPELAPMVASLTDFLVAWTGGPRDWFEQRPGACIMSMHVVLPGLARTTATQWIDAMSRAMGEIQPGDAQVRKLVVEALGRMCDGMAARAAHLASQRETLAQA